jgi:uncharacterized protein (DUF58 family)
MRKLRMAGVVLLLGFLAALPAIGFATGGTAFTVERFVVAEGIQDREPVNVTEKLRHRPRTPSVFSRPGALPETPTQYSYGIKTTRSSAG